MSNRRRSTARGLTPSTYEAMADKAGVASRAGAAKSGAAAVVASEERSSSSPQRSGAPRKRIRNFTADDRAAHRVFEKSRREAFKHKLIELANLLPVMLDIDSRRLSKHVVVDESINRHRLQQARCESAAQGVRTLLEERDTLLAEVNRWRSETGAAVAMPIVSAGMFSGMLAAEQEMFKEKLGSMGTTPPPHRGGAMMMDDDGYGSGDSPTGSTEEMNMRAAGVPSQAPGMPVLDPSLRLVDRVDIKPPTSMSDKEAAAMAARRHPEMDMHRATMFGAFDMAGMPQGQQQQPRPQAHQQPPPPHQQQQRLPTEYMPHAPAGGMRVGVDLRHNGGVSPAQQQQLAPPGAYDPVAAAAQHGHPHGHAPMQHAHAHGHDQGQQQQQHATHTAHVTHSIPMPTTQAQYMNHMGGIPYMSNMGWQ